VFAGAQCLMPMLAVQMIGRADGDGINVVACQQLIKRAAEHRDA
jgi:hypothetical protein